MKLFGRYVLAVFVAPFAVFPAVFLSFGIALLAGVEPSTKFSDYLGSALFFSAFGTVYGWFFLIVFGLPAFGILARADLDYAVPSAITGGVIGFLIGLTMFGVFGSWFSMLLMLCGAAVAAAFCRVLNGTWGPPNPVKAAPSDGAV